MSMRAPLYVFQGFVGFKHLYVSAFPLVAHGGHTLRQRADQRMGACNWSAPCPATLGKARLVAWVRACVTQGRQPCCVGPLHCERVDEGAKGLLLPPKFHLRAFYKGQSLPKSCFRRGGSMVPVAAYCGLDLRRCHHMRTPDSMEKSSEMCWCPCAKTSLFWSASASGRINHNALC